MSLIQRYARLRLLLRIKSKSDYGQVVSTVGPHAARALRRLEDYRKKLLDGLPNRLFVLRVRNQSSQDAEDFILELKVGGEVYDVTVNGENGKAQSLESSPDHIVVNISRIRPGNTTDIQVWYRYLPLSKRVFPDPADFEWEKTQGIVVLNLGVSNGQVHRINKLLVGLDPYEFYPYP